SRRRSPALRATWIESGGMPTAFSPPSVSRLNTIVALYFSGSRVLIGTPDSLAEVSPLSLATLELAMEFEFAFVFELALELVSTVILQPPSTNTAKAQSTVPVFAR